MTWGGYFDGYFADPFVLRLGEGYAAYGSGGASSPDRVFEALSSVDLETWRSRGPVLERLAPEFGDEYWAPEVAFADGAYWMYYSVGHGISGHHIRVARSSTPFGPFTDLGLNLTPGERFAIDAHPFFDAGRWYLYFARDVLEAQRPGTQLAVAPLHGMTVLGETTTVLEPDADWQIYERGRQMYGATYDWHTLEGPSVIKRHGRYWLTYSGGAWTGAGYAMAWAVADSPLGPWTPGGTLLAGTAGLIGPGHNSLTTGPSGDVIAFHSWDAAHTARRMQLRRISFELEGPRVDGPIRGSSTSHPVWEHQSEQVDPVL